MSDGIDAPSRSSHASRVLRGETVPTLITIAILAGAFFAVYAVAVHTVWGQRIDAASLGYVAPWRDLLGGLPDLTRSWTPTVLAAAALLTGIVALRSGQWRRVLTGLLVVLGTSVSSELLKSNLARPYLGSYGYEFNTFPSGHESATAALAIAILLMWRGGPPRPVVIAGGVVVIFAGLSTVVTYAHRASDPIGSVLLAGAMALTVCLVMRVPPEMDRSSSAG